MDDRVSRYPGRVKLTPVEGQENVYDMVLADEPITTGTRLNKANLLSDQVATLIGLNTSAVPDDMFNVLATAGDLHVWRRTKSGVIDYPVSTNPNAYQEGSDAKPAGYTLGAVQSGKFRLIGAGATYRIGPSVSVDDSGNVTIQSSGNTYFDYKSAGAINSTHLNKFWQLVDYADSPSRNPESLFLSKQIFFIPSSAVASQDGSLGICYISKYQTVTGYAAIQAGTTIEYLGKLGDKSRMQIVSYVGTGTYGASHPCSITADFPIKSAMCLGFVARRAWKELTESSSRNVVPAALTTEYKVFFGFCFGAYSSSSYAKKSSDGKTINWYNKVSDELQLNQSGNTYYFLLQT